MFNNEKYSKKVIATIKRLKEKIEKDATRPINKTCADCGKDISHKISNRAIRCRYCQRKKDGSQPNRRKRIDRVVLTHRILDDIIYRLYDHRCAICKWRASENRYMNPSGYRTKTYGCEIHHIIAVSKGGNDDIMNVILLCPNHHRQANLKLISIRKFRSYQIPEDKIESTVKASLEAEGLAEFENLVKAADLMDNLF